MNTRTTLTPLFKTLALGAMLVFTGQAMAATQGAQLYKAHCMACHGANGAGNAALMAPPLAGSDKDYVVRQLLNFRSQRRGGDTPQGSTATMQAVAATLPNDAAVQALGSYIATLKPVMTKGVVAQPGSPLNTGKALFSVCVACHGGQGEGTPALAAPRLNHLPAWYLTTQLQAFRAGLRGFHAEDQPGQQMRQIANDALVDDEAIQAVAAYIASLGNRAR
jgi:cytochrome c553